MQKTVFRTSLIIFGTIVVACVCLHMRGVMRLGGEDTLFDLSSGEVRKKTIVVGIAIFDSRLPSPFGDLCRACKIQPMNPCWKTVSSTWAFTGMSPHYDFHSAVADSNDAVRVIEMAKATDEQKCSMAKKYANLFYQGDLKKVRAQIDRDLESLVGGKK